MSAPKPGDRVRVTETYEGVWTNRNTHGSGMWGVVAAKDFDVDFLVTNYAKVEVLPKPVYVNHDTTEYRENDIVRAFTGVLYIRQGKCWCSLVTGSTYGDVPELTLLVRDGQAVA